MLQKNMAVQEDDRENWKVCLDWLVDCGVLTNSIKDVHRLSQALRDGVQLCRLINKIRPGTIDSRDYSSRPQSSRFLYLRNIGVFLAACSKVFGLKESALFDAGDLIDGKDFNKVIHTLSLLSNSKEAKKSSIDGFSIKREEIYSTSPIYDDDDTDDDSDDDDEDQVYQTLVECAALKPSASLISRRDHCLNELLDTENKYVQVLHLIIERFKKPLRGVITDKELKTVFLNTEKLYELHVSFYADLQIACFAVVETITVADCFLNRKDKFASYGSFCAGLTQSQKALLKLCKDKPHFKELLDRLNEAANNRQFRLHELLTVPFQRILKYHLLLKKLVGHTSVNHPEYAGLSEALDAMLDVSFNANVVKRDFDAMESVNEIEKSFLELRMYLPPDTHLKDYGRCLFDGEVKLKSQTSKEFQTRYLFLFDKVLLICKPKRNKYSYKDYIIIAHYQLISEEKIQVDETTMNSFGLQERPSEHGFHAKRYVFDANAPELYHQWKDALDIAFDNVRPAGSSTPSHEFCLTTFCNKDAVTCAVCHKLLKGLLYQGYRCQKTSISVHKACIIKVDDKDTLSTNSNAAVACSTTKSRVESSISSENGELTTTSTANNKFASASSTVPNKSAEPNTLHTNKRSAISNYAQTDTIPANTAWFAGSIQRKEAVTLLQGAEEGTFLVRNSLETATLSLSVKCPDDCIKHIRIFRTAKQSYYLVADFEFPTVSALIAHYQRHSLGEYFRSIQVVLKSPYQRDIPVVNHAADTESRIVGHCQALFDFSARHQRELSFCKNDRIAIISKKGKWWKGLFNGKSGIFPSNFVEVLPAS